MIYDIDDILYTIHYILQTICYIPIYDIHRIVQCSAVHYSAARFGVEWRDMVVRPNFILIIFILRILGAIVPGDPLETEDFHPSKIRNWLSQTS